MPPTSCTRSAREAASAWLVAIVLLLALADPAIAQDRARLRWAPGGKGGPAVGYLVHVRRAETPQYPVPLEVGTASAGPTGTREYVIEGLDPSAAYVISVSAYGESGVPSVSKFELCGGMKGRSFGLRMPPWQWRSMPHAP